MRSKRWTRRQVVAAGAIVTAGCAAALAHATTACITGGDPEKMQQLPKLDGLRDQVIMPKQSRNVFDHAIRMTGVTMVEIETRKDLERAIGPWTAAIAVLDTGEPKGKVRLEEIAPIAKRTRVPVLVDAAAELPVTPNPYLTRGADRVAYSGGKFLHGPQSAGILLGRDDLVKAAWLNSSPHHAFGRAMKVGKEEIMGMLAAIEVWKSGYDFNAESLTGEIDGDKGAFRNGLPNQGTRRVYEFNGAIVNDAMGGDVGLGEYGKARWSARRV